jgi:hypothetical protein
MLVYILSRKIEEDKIKIIGLPVFAYIIGLAH